MILIISIKSSQSPQNAGIFHSQYPCLRTCVQGVQYCNRLFAMEDSITKKYPGNYEKRKQLRLEKEKPVLEAFWSWLDQQKPVRNEKTIWPSS